MIISSTTKLRPTHHALSLLSHPRPDHPSPPPPNPRSSITTTPTPLLSLLTQRRSLDHLKQIQAQLIFSGLLSDPFTTSRLVASFASSTAPGLPYCASILTHIDNPNAFSWNAGIRAYSNGDDPNHSLILYKRMLATNARPDNYTLPFIFKVCGKLSDHRLGEGVLCHAVGMGLISEVFVLNAGMHMFVACSRLEDARKLFDGSFVRDLVSWNTLINGYVQRGQPLKALSLFREMEAERVWPDEVTMIGLVSCCAQLEELELGRRFHHYVEDAGLELTVRLTNALIDMYVKCGSLEPARALFDGMTKRTVVSWTTMIVGYARFGKMDAARKVFDEMPERDVVPWNAMIAGYVQCQQGKEALAFFHEMQASQVEPDVVTMVCILSASSQLGALEMGLWIHRYIEKHNICLNVMLGTALVDMYAKCGNIDKSLLVFREIPEKNALTWTAMICGLASHGHAEDAIRLFREMVEIGLQPDEVTFIGVLSACCHAGLVDEGRMFFTQMRSKYNLSPRMKHFSCMVDILGRAGLLDEAEELIQTMPLEPDAVVWGALFFACRIHGNVPMGERAAAKLLELEPHESGIYVLLANMYTEANLREEADKARLLMKEMGVEKVPGCSSIEINGVVYEFIVRDKSHARHKEIYACLTRLAKQMEIDGSTPDIC